MMKIQINKYLCVSITCAKSLAASVRMQSLNCVNAYGIMTTLWSPKLFTVQSVICGIKSRNVTQTRHKYHSGLNSPRIVGVPIATKFKANSQISSENEITWDTLLHTPWSQNSKYATWIYDLKTKKMKILRR